VSNPGGVFCLIRTTVAFEVSNPGGEKEIGLEYRFFVLNGDRVRKIIVIYDDLFNAVFFLFAIFFITYLKSFIPTIIFKNKTQNIKPAQTRLIFFARRENFETIF